MKAYRDDYPYFEPFIYLPPRSLKDYYEVIAEPLSLKKLQKQVRGQHGRSEATYVSDFKGWSAFEDQASLIWKNAYHYNEDGSDIFTMAQELEVSTKTFPVRTSVLITIGNVPRASQRSQGTSARATATQDQTEIAASCRNFCAPQEDHHPRWRQK